MDTSDDSGLEASVEVGFSGLDYCVTAMLKVDAVAGISEQQRFASVAEVPIEDLPCHAFDGAPIDWAVDDNGIVEVEFE